MIHSIFSSSKTFHTVEFSTGFNIVLAEKSNKATAKDSRNGLGKTTLIDIIHFCFGSDLKNSRLNVPELKDWDFQMDLTVSKTRMIVKRYLSDVNKIFIEIKEGINPFDLKTDEERGENYTDLNSWKNYLGKCWFSIPKEKKKNQPTFRQIINFFARRDGGYDNAFNTLAKEKESQKILNNAYVLGLDWEKAIDLYGIQKKIEHWNALKKVAADTGETKGRLQAQLITMEDGIKNAEKELSEFNVLPEYTSIQDEANSIIKQIQSLSNNNMFLHRKLEAYVSATTTEKTPSSNYLINLYNEAKIVLSDSVKKTLEDASSFHNEVIKNRKVFLENEMTFIKNEMDSISQSIKSLSERKQELMKVLSSHGALDEYNKMQEIFLKKKDAYEKLKAKLDEMIKMAAEINTFKKNADAIKQQLEKELPINNQYTDDVKVFCENNKAVHDKKGMLVVDFNTKGNYKFDIDIEKGSSSGVKRVGICCYDLMLIENVRKHCEWGIDFLIHDSYLFDPIEERQRANCMALALKKSNENGFQYILTLNSDQIPYNDLPEGFDVADYIRIKLTDENIKSSLLGIQISNPVKQEDVAEEDVE